MDRKTGAIQRCEKRGWINQVWLDIPEKEKPPGFEVSKYYYSNVYPILERIESELIYSGKSLKSNERNDLEEILDSDSFRAILNIASDKIDYNKNVDTFNIVIELLSVLGAFALICKNYILYLSKKHKKHIPKKYRNMNISRLGKQEYDEIKKEAHKKGLDFDKIIDESFDLLAQLLPSRIHITISDELQLSKELGNKFMSLSSELCDKISSLASYYTDFFIMLIGLSFLVPEETNSKTIDSLSRINTRLIEFVKRKGFRLPKI